MNGLLSVMLLGLAALTGCFREENYPQYEHQEIAYSIERSEECNKDGCTDVFTICTSDRGCREHVFDGGRFIERPTTPPLPTDEGGAELPDPDQGILDK